MCRPCTLVICEGIGLSFALPPGVEGCRMDRLTYDSSQRWLTASGAGGSRLRLSGYTDAVVPLFTNEKKP